MEHKPTLNPLSQKDKKFGVPKQKPYLGNVKIRTGARNGSRKKHGGEEIFVIRRELASGSTVAPMSFVKGYLKGNPNGNFLVTVRLGEDGDVTASGGGVINKVYPDNPTTAQNWANYAAVFDEYRVLALQVKFEPLRGFGGGTALYWAPIATVIDRSDSTALTGYGLAERYESHVKHAGWTAWTVSALMSDVGESDFIPTTTSIAKRWIKLYSSNNTAGNLAGRVDIKYVVQFRGLGIN